MSEIQIIDAKEAAQCGLGEYPVTVVPHYEVAMSDGVKLAFKVWLPYSSTKGTCFEGHESYCLYDPKSKVTEVAQPAILEYLPYGKSTMTAYRDYQRHSWWCSHGYVCVRVDMRGSGDSEGFYYDEYLAQEQQDCCEVIAWIAKQPWCTGSVGMYGKSWGGFNGLQVAYEQPPALKTAISLYSTDDRYRTDCHYEGGCVLGFEMQSWSTQMLAWNAKPPSPVFRPNDWKDLWKKRLEKSCYPWIESWLSHQTRDEFWRHGSVCEDPSRVNIPILAIGGWRDAYQDAVFSMAESLPNFRGIIGPWSHEWPDVSKPGPKIDFVNLCLQWWDFHLKGITNGAMDRPYLTLYVQGPLKPGIYPEDRQGYWVTELSWPPKEECRYLELFLNNHNSRLISSAESGEAEAGQMKDKVVPFNVQSGSWCGEWLSFGADDCAGDQKYENMLGLSWTTNGLSEDVVILGNPLLKITLKVENETAVLAARLSHEFPGGQCSLITYGVLNLCHRKGHAKDEVSPLKLGESIVAEVKLQSTSYTIPKGHKLILSVSANYWPYVWPSRDQVTMSCVTGGDNMTKLELPVVTSPEKKEPFQPPKPLLKPQTTTLYKPDTAFARRLEIGLSEPQSSIKMAVDDGKTLNHEAKVATWERCHSNHSVSHNDHMTAKTIQCNTILYEFEAAEEGKITADITAKSEMWSDKEFFHTVNKLDVLLNGESFFNRTWEKNISREHV